MAHSEETRRKISEKVKARYAADPEYKAKVAASASGRGRATAASRRAVIEERDALLVEVEQLRAEVTRLRGDR